MGTYLSSEDYISLYSELAQRRIQTLLDTEFLKDCYLEEEGSGTRFTEEAQDAFNTEVDIVCEILEAHNIHQIGE
jgi:hypothetical protein|tara:strand:- start:891 stop:1115 length:225 start_codon:yes stop_codon:yes gene_type:complete